MYAKAVAAEPNNPGLRLRYATALAKGRMKEARSVVADQYARTPDRPDVTRALALLQLVSGSPKEALAGFDRLLAKDPDNTAGALDKAVAFDLMGRHSDAQAIYRGLLARSPDDAAVKNNLAMSLTLERRTQEALNLLMPMAGSDTPARIRTNIAILMAANGEAQGSRDLMGTKPRPLGSWHWRRL